LFLNHNKEKNEKRARGCTGHLIQSSQLVDEKTEPREKLSAIGTHPQQDSDQDGLADCKMSTRQLYISVNGSPNFCINPMNLLS
jgi:hypothetical protein